MSKLTINGDKMTFYFDSGKPSRHPTSYDEALDINHKMYNDEIKCSSCNTSSVKYTKNKACILCSRMDAITFHAFHHGHSYVWTDDSGVHYAQPQARTAPTIISDNDWSAMSKLSEVCHTDKIYSVSPDPCKLYGHVGLRRSGKCYMCELEKKKPSPRQAAKLSGEKWYTPIEPCIRCDKIAPKRVDNGTCSGCAPDELVDGRETADSIIMRQEPDMVIDCATASEMGMKVYRTGEECKRGHAGWRYVKTRTCIPCLRGEK